MTQHEHNAEQAFALFTDCIASAAEGIGAACVQYRMFGRKDDAGSACDVQESSAACGVEHGEGG